MEVRIFALQILVKRQGQTEEAFPVPFGKGHDDLGMYIGKGYDTGGIGGKGVDSQLIDHLVKLQLRALDLGFQNLVGIFEPLIKIEAREDQDNDADQHDRFIFNAHRHRTLARN